MSEYILNSVMVTMVDNCFLLNVTVNRPNTYTVSAYSQSFELNARFNKQTSPPNSTCITPLHPGTAICPFRVCVLFYAIQALFGQCKHKMLHSLMNAF